MTGRVAILGGLAERLDDENCTVGSAEQIRPHPGMRLGYGGKNSDQVRLWQIPEGQKLPTAEWRELAIAEEDFACLQSHLGKPTRATPPSQLRPFWKEVEKAIMAELERNGCPAPGDGNQARLERFTADLLSEHGHDAAESTIRRRVTKCMKDYQASLC